MNIPDDFPQWKRLCIVAITELDPTGLVQRIDKARHAVLDRVEDGFGRSDGEQVELRNALEALNLLEKSIER